ncbi:MAG: hypothetical protein L0H63_04030, partial [Nitrococcus sp.]|nr:hypothetical protein [Nitrococcus sp.]
NKFTLHWTRLKFALYWTLYDNLCSKEAVEKSNILSKQRAARRATGLMYPPWRPKPINLGHLLVNALLGASVL